MIEQGADINNFFYDYTPLIEVCKEGKLDIIKYFIENGADVNVVAKDSSPLIEACKQGRFNIIKHLIQKGADANIATQQTYPLLEACKKGRLDIVKYLVENKANVNFESNTTFPLLEVCKQGRLDIAQYLLEQGARVSEIGYTSPLIEALQIKQFTLAKCLVEYGANVDQTYHDGSGKSYPIISSSLVSGKQDLIQFMQEAKSLQKALSKKQYILAQKLADKDVEITKITPNELKQVIVDRQYQLAETLINKGVKTDSVTTPLLRQVIANKKFNFATLLVEKGVKTTPELEKILAQAKEDELKAIEQEDFNEQIEINNYGQKFDGNVVAEMSRIGKQILNLRQTLDGLHKSHLDLSQRHPIKQAEAKKYEEVKINLRDVVTKHEEVKINPDDSFSWVSSKILGNQDQGTEQKNNFVDNFNFTENGVKEVEFGGDSKLPDAA